MNVLGLIQLCQSTQPGRYSFGIEELAARERPTTPEHLAELVTSVLQTDVARADGIASGVAFRAARRCQYEALVPVCRALSNSHVPDPIRHESIQRIA